MKYLLIVLLLAGCSTTVPVSRKFPEVPNTLLEKCADLKLLNNDAKLSDITKTVTLNYSTYYDCSVKHNGWIEWYSVQKKIFEEK
jgi:hypothetical protein